MNTQYFLHCIGKTSKTVSIYLICISEQFVLYSSFIERVRETYLFRNYQIRPSPAGQIHRHPASPLPGRFLYHYRTFVLSLKLLCFINDKNVWTPPKSRLIHFMFSISTKNRVTRLFPVFFLSICNFFYLSIGLKSLFSKKIMTRLTFFN